MDWFKRSSAWISANGLTALALTIAGIQSLLLLWALNGPYQSNLHDREIEVCEALITRYNAHRTNVQLTQIAGTYYEKWSPGDNYEPTISSKFGVANRFIEVSSELTESISRMEIYAGEGTKTLLLELRKILLTDFSSQSDHADSNTFEIVPMNQSQNELTWRELMDALSYPDTLPSEEIFEKIYGICRSVMLGKDGFI